MEQLQTIARLRERQDRTARRLLAQNVLAKRSQAFYSFACPWSRTRSTPERRSQVRSCRFHRPDRMSRGAGVRRTAEAKVRPQLDHGPVTRLALPLWRDIGLHRIHVEGNEQGTRRRRGRPIFQGRHAKCRSASRNIVPMCDLCNCGSGHPNRHDNLELLLIAPSTRPFPPKYFNTSQIHLGHRANGVSTCV